MSDWFMPVTTWACLILGWLFFIRGKMASREDIKDLSKEVRDMNTRLGGVEGVISRLEFESVSRKPGN